MSKAATIVDLDAPIAFRPVTSAVLVTIAAVLPKLIRLSRFMALVEPVAEDIPACWVAQLSKVPERFALTRRMLSV
jgi:hypothetical protein